MRRPQLIFHSSSLLAPLVVSSPPRLMVLLRVALALVTSSTWRITFAKPDDTSTPLSDGGERAPRARGLSTPRPLPVMTSSLLRQNPPDESCPPFHRREAVVAWSGRVGPPCRPAPADAVQPLFNDLHLYPTKSQVFEMLVCAQRCARRRDFSLSFGEFCVFAAELKKRARRRNLSSKSGDGAPRERPPPRRPDPPYEVFLGGSCNPTTWRWDVAIPTLEKMGITYFNPQVADWSSELIEIEHDAKESARVLFFVLDAETRAAAAAVEAAHLASTARSRRLVLVLQPYRRGQRIGGEPVPDQEYLDLSRGRAILQEVAERRDLPVFGELETALRRTHLILRGREPAPTPEIARHLLTLRSAFDDADSRKSGRLTATEAIAAIRSLTGVKLSVEELEGIAAAHAAAGRCAGPPSPSPSVDYETFCSVVAEVDADSRCPDENTSTSSETAPAGDGRESGPRSVGGEAAPAGWRRLLDRVRAAVFAFVQKLELSTSSARLADPQLRTSSSNSANNTGNRNAFLRNSSEMTGLSRINNNATHEAPKSKRKTISEENIKPKENVDSRSNSNGRQMPRKLSVFIPKLTAECNGLTDGDRAGSSILTPQTSRRLENLAESVRDEVDMRDVYLGGSGTVRTNWREETVVPILEKHNFTFYIPVMNDYNRMFSAPPHTPAGGAKFTFDGISYGRNGDGPNANVSMSSSRMFPTERSESLSQVAEDGADVSDSNMTASKYDHYNSVDLTHRNSSNNTLAENKEPQDGGRLPHKHERSPAFGEDQPEKRPKYSKVEAQNSEDDEIELRNKTPSQAGYPLQMSNSTRLSASDFYKIPENASPSPFRGMYDERQLWGSRVLLFGVTRDTRCLAPMVLAAHCIGLRPRSVVLCIQYLNRPEGLSEQAVKDYNRGRMYLRDLAIREEVPVFDNLEEATNCVIEKLQNGNY